MNTDVTIVIPNFNGAKLLQRNLPFVLTAAATYGMNTAVIVVDDGSTDDSVAFIREKFPQVELVVHDQNKGFAEAVYSGISAARTELIFLLNSDVQPEPDCLHMLAEYFESPDTFSVGPLIKDEHGKINRHSWNVRHFRWGQLKPVRWRVQDALAARQEGRLLSVYASGGSVMLRKSMFMDLGGFNSLFKPFYGEDYDLGLRAWRRGWKTYFEPRVSVTHQREGSSIKSNTKRAYVKRVRRRNKLVLEWIHLPARRLWLGAIPLALWQLLGELLLADKVNVVGFCTAVTRIPEVLRQRRVLKRSQKLSFGEMLTQVSKQRYS